MADDAGEGSGPTEPTRRVASYGVCVRDGALLMVAVTDPTDARETWTLPGEGVEPLEDPVDTVVREITEETGRTGRVVRLLGVDSRVIPAHEAVRGVPHQNIGIFYEVPLDGSASGADRKPQPTASEHSGTACDLREESNGDSRTPSWIPLGQVTDLRRSNLVDVGLDLLATRPASGHASPPPMPGHGPPACRRCAAGAS